MATTKVPPTTLKPSSRAALERRRKGFVARAPSGEWYRLRQLGIERHAFAGGMPPSLAQVVGESEESVAKLLAELSRPDQTEAERAASREVVGYLDKVVLASVMDPHLTDADLGAADDLASDPVLPPEDYMWLVSVALRSTAYDAEGRRLFGFEPEMQLALFRNFHECPDDCEHCEEVTAALEKLAGS
jgi:hypothetical protein